MIEQFFSDPRTILRFRSCALGTHIDGFAHWLSEQGYTRLTAKYKVGLVGAFGTWCQRCRLDDKGLSEERLRKFLRYRSRRVRIRSDDSRTLGDFLKYLRERNVIPSPAFKVSCSAVDQILSGYTQYLVQERGLSQSTLDNYGRVVRCLLSEYIGEETIQLDRLRPPDISRFILRRTRQSSVRRVQLEVSALRSFFRFLYQRGETTRNLGNAIPSISNWHAAVVPKYIEPEEVEALLSSCDLGSRIGRRDHAILLLLARLGLRAGEVVHLVLDDIDWQTGELIVRGKSARHGRLPIPHDVGKALANYLYQDRPRCSSRRVFICTKAPHRGIATSATVCDVVRNALKRAGLNPSFKGSHLLRHSLATHLLRKGSTLAEIGEILRHQSPSSTEIYAKVDIVALRALAQAWKGGTP